MMDGVFGVSISWCERGVHGWEHLFSPATALFKNKTQLHGYNFIQASLPLFEATYCELQSLSALQLFLYIFLSGDKIMNEIKDESFLNVLYSSFLNILSGVRFIFRDIAIKRMFLKANFLGSNVQSVATFYQYNSGEALSNVTFTITKMQTI